MLVVRGLSGRPLPGAPRHARGIDPRGARPARGRARRGDPTGARAHRPARAATVGGQSSVSAARAPRRPGGARSARGARDRGRRARSGRGARRRRGRGGGVIDVRAREGDEPAGDRAAQGVPEHLAVRLGRGTMRGEALPSRWARSVASQGRPPAPVLPLSRSAGEGGARIPPSTPAPASSLQPPVYSLP